MDVAEIEAQIDPRKALASLGYAETSEPQRVTGGWDTLLWRFGTPDGREHSLRVFSPHLLKEVAWRERIALDRCAEAGLPAPRVEKVGEVQGLPAMVLSWCPGVPIMSFVEKKPWTLWRLGRLLGRTQAKLHTVTPPPEFVEKAPDDWLKRVPDGYADLVAHASSLKLSTSCFIHMDFHLANLVTDGTTATGILDWPSSGAGDPRADLARTEITHLAAPVPPSIMRPLLNLARNVFLGGWRSGYREAAGAVPDYRPLRAWAGATFLAEMELEIDRPGVWATKEDLESLRRRVEAWAREAGIRR